MNIELLYRNISEVTPKIFQTMKIKDNEKG